MAIKKSDDDDDDDDGSLRGKKTVNELYMKKAKE
jgi:hypothetical protein